MPADAWDDDDRIGIPRAGATLPPRVRVAVEVEPEPELRPGDAGLGRPPQVARDLAPLSDADRQAIAADAEAQALRELAEAEELLATDPGVKWVGWLAHPLAAAFLIGGAGVLGLFLFSQLMTVLGQLAAQPMWAQYAGYAALALLGGAVLYAMMRLLFLYAKLQRNRQVRLDGLAELHSRTQLRWLAHAKTGEAKARLEQYLSTYPVADPRGRKLLGTVGVTDDLAAGLLASRERLLDAGRFASTNEWFAAFRDEFQAKLDEAAEARVKYWANRAMLVTAVSPNGLVDSLATTYFGFALLTDLCRVYNLKAGRSGTAVLLGRVFFNAYLAGNLNDLEKIAEDQYDQIFQQGMAVVGVGVGSNVAGKLLGKVGAKATTGYLNRLLLLRLGRYGCRLLRPVEVR